MTRFSKKYNPMLHSQLAAMVSGHDWERIPAYFTKLSNASFRLAGPILADVMAERLDANAYWRLAAVMVQYNTRAFLVTLLKGALHHQVAFQGEGFEELCRQLSTNAIDVEKTCELLLPRLLQPQELQHLLELLQVTDVRLRVRLLLRQSSNAAAYVLFHTLKTAEGDHELLLRTAKYMIQMKSDRCFNFASLLTAYFDLKEVKAVFSLKIEPYQLAWLEGSYEAFCKALNK